MNEMTGYEVFVAAYANECGAHSALHTLEDMDKAGSIEVIDAALIAKDMEGKVSVVETAELTPKKGASRSAVIGAVLGVIFPPSLLAGQSLAALDFKCTIQQYGRGRLGWQPLESSFPILRTRQITQWSC